MLEQDDGTYKEDTSSTWPTDMTFNSELSGCIDLNGNKIDNSLTFNSEANSVTIKTSQTTYCYVYFDKKKPSVTLTVKTDGEDNILPSYNHYNQTLTCDNGTTSTFNVKYQRIEISNVGNANSKCSLNYSKDTNSYTLLKDKVEEVNTTYNNGYRYSGKQPQNYVWFNNELWRIIGSIPTTLKDKTVENRVKIIRAESIGGLIYNSSNSNLVWGSGNTLYTLLNSYYYGKKDGNGENLCKRICNYTNKGISSDSNDYYGRMLIDVYMNAGSVSTTVEGTYASEKSTLTSNTAKIGIMTSSDYGYATSEIIYSNVYLSDIDSYGQNNWLYYQGQEWTMTPNSLYKMLRVYGRIVNDGNAYNDAVVRPALYLNPDVYIISGKGTENNPYILGM